MTVSQLKDQCKTKKIKVPAKSKRDDIIKLLESIKVENEIPTENVQEISQEKMEEELTTTVLKETGNFTKIYQISDIHIRPTNDRNVEFQQVFDKFAAEVKISLANFHKEMQSISKVPKSDEILITITGDIFDKKNGLTPENILLARDFFYKLGQIAPVFIILGNHDTILQDVTTDSLSAVLHLIPNVYYLKYSGYYQYGNVMFAVSSLLDNKVCRITQKDPTKVYVGLYHGTITGSLMFNGTSIKEDTLLKLGDFGNFDLLLLGDIHKMQFFQKNAAYPGSLVQQNFGETVNGHGYILWDLQKKEGIFHEIKSDYAFITVVCKDSKVTMPTDISHIKNVYLRVFYPKNDKENYNLSEIYSKFNVVYLREEFGSVDSKSFQETKTENVISKEQLMKEFLVEKGYPQDVISEIIKFDKEISSQEKLDTNKPSWGLNNIKFKNVFIYGGDKEHTIDFNNNTGFMKIFGTNAIGKSTITNIITFGIFGEVNDMDLMDVPHNGASNAYVHLEIQVGSLKYLIKRNIVSKGKNNLVVYKSCTLEKDNGLAVELIASSGAQVKTKIEELIGSYEEFELTSLISNKHIGLLNLKPIDRHKIICRLLKLDNYKKLEDIGKAKRKENDKLIDTLSGALEVLQAATPEKIAEMKTQLEQLKSIEYTYHDTEKIDTKIKRRREKIESLSRQIFPIHDSLTDYTDEINKLVSLVGNKNPVEIQKEMNIIQKEITKLSSEFKPVDSVSANIPENISKFEKIVKQGINTENYQPKYDRISGLISQQRRKLFKLEPVESPTDKITQKTKEYNKLKSDKDSLEGELIKISNKILELYKTIINVNIENTTEIDTTIPELKESLKKVVNSWVVNTKVLISEELKNNFQKLLNDNGLSLIKNLMDNNKTIQKEIAKLEKEKSEIETKLGSIKISDLERQLLNLETQKDKYEKYQKDKLANEEIEKELEILEKDLSNVSTKIKEQMQKQAEYNEAVEILRIHKKWEDSKIAMEFNAKLKEKIQKKQDLLTSLTGLFEKTIRLNDLKKLQENFELLEEKKKNNDKLNESILILKEELNGLLVKLDDIRKLNVEIDIQKSQNESEIAVLQTKLDSLNNEFAKKTQLQDKLEEHKKLANMYDIYISMMNASCLPSIILDKHIPVLEKNVNEILTPMTSFQVKIIIKGSTLVFRHIKSTGTDITISACSGYEYFMLNLALKFSLAKFGYIPFPSFISIDEGWDVVSESNYPKLQKMFDKLYSTYRNIIIISHLPKIQYILDSYVGSNITIQNVNGVSSIN